MSNFDEFNNFQTAFYSNREKFQNFSRFEVKRCGYILLNNIAKGFPALSDLILNLKGFDWSGPESKEVLRALQNRFYGRTPQFIYFKQTTDKPSKTKEKIKSTKEGDLFAVEIQREICSILKYDSKTYEYLKFSEKVQSLGHQILGEFMQKEKIKSSTKTKKK